MSPRRKTARKSASSRRDITPSSFAASAATVDTAGEFVTTDGTVVGTHEGIEGFTVGQRKGLGIALGEPKFVVRIEPANQSRRARRSRRTRARIRSPRRQRIGSSPPKIFRVIAQVQIRYNTAPVGASVQILPGKRISVEFDEPQHGVAPGQAVVCYDGDRTLGGGWIESYCNPRHTIAADLDRSRGLRSHIQIRIVRRFCLRRREVHSRHAHGDCQSPPGRPRTAPACSTSCRERTNPLPTAKPTSSSTA